MNKSAIAIVALVASATVFAMPGGAPAAPAPSAAPLKGEVLEVREAPPYTYLRLKTAQGETWAAVTAAPVKKGAQVAIANPAVMENFESKTLKRTFDKIVFGTLADPNAPATASAATMPPHGATGGPKLGAPTPAPAVAKVAKATGADARTVEEVNVGKAKLKDRSVSLRAQVVKVNAGIMGKNWLHVQDGSGSAGAGTNDILVTSDEETPLQPLEMTGTRCATFAAGVVVAFAVALLNHRLGHASHHESDGETGPLTEQERLLEQGSRLGL